MITPPLALSIWLRHCTVVRWSKTTRAGVTRSALRWTESAGWLGWVSSLLCLLIALVMMMTIRLYYSPTTVAAAAFLLLLALGARSPLWSRSKPEGWMSSSMGGALPGHSDSAP